MVRYIFRIGIFTLIIIFIPQLVFADPPANITLPFVTDRPEPVQYQHVELDFFTQGTHTNNSTAGVIAGVDANYGVSPDVTLTLITPLAFSTFNNGPTSYGYGDTQFAVKYRFLRQSPDEWWPQIAIYPAISVPTGNVNRSLGSGNVDEYFPVLLLKDFSPWQTYGGGGYWNNPGAGNKNYWYFSWALQRKITSQLSLGGELFHQTANKSPDQNNSGLESAGSQDSTGFDLGATYDFNENYHVLFTVGRGLQYAEETNLFSYYLTFQLTF
jgi:hypothetical protein